MRVSRQFEIIVVPTRGIGQRPGGVVDPAAAPRLDATPELAAAWKELQLYWLRTVPGLRDELRQRVSERARAIEERSRRFDFAYGVEVDQPQHDLSREWQRRVQRGLRELTTDSHAIT